MAIFSRPKPDRHEKEQQTELQEMRDKHRWSGQSHCGQCGTELKTEEISHRNDYDPYSGRFLGKPVKVIWCNNLEYVYAWTGTRYAASAQALWLGGSAGLTAHDYWFLEP